VLYLDSTPPPAKVTHMTDKEQKEWVKEVQGLSEQYAALFIHAIGTCQIVSWNDIIWLICD